MKGSPFHRNYGIGSPAKQATPDVEGEKKVLNKRKKAIEDHRKNAPKTTNTQEQADQLNAIEQANVDAYNTSNDSIQNVHDLYRADIEKQNAVIDSTNTANKAAYDKYIESTKKKKKKSPAKQGLRNPDLDYSDPEVLRKEKEGNQRIHDIRTGKYDRDKKEQKRNRPPKKKSPAKQTTSDTVKRSHLYDGKPKNGKPDSYNGPRSKGGLLPRDKSKGPRDGMKVTDVKKYSKKSPAKCPLLALAPAAIAAVGAMKKNKEE